MQIEISSVEYAYQGGIAALRGVSLSVAPGEAVAIVGQNGSGKTTLAKHLNGLLRPSAGAVRVGGWDTREHTVAQLARRVGYVFQNPDEQIFQRTVRAEAAFGPLNLGLAAEQARRRAEAALEAVGLLAEADRHPYDLSLGERKRLALAAVLAMDTPVVVLDEPTTGQDAAGAALAGRVVDDLRREGRTAIAITHDMEFCAEHFPRVVVMGGGRVLLDGPARETLAQEAILAQTSVEPPQLVRLARRLGMDGAPLTVGEFCARLG